MTQGNDARAIPLFCRLGLAVLALVAVAAVAPAMASATTVWVSPNPVKAPFNSCANPGYNKLQEAINVNAPATFNVCKGTYEEQVVIEKELTITGLAGSKLKLPASPAESTTPCTVAEKEQDEVSICGAVKVKIVGLTVEALWPGGTCNDNLYGIIVGGGAKVGLSNDKVIGAGVSPINGCQGGVGVQVGRAHGSEPSEAGHSAQVGIATLTGDQVSSYQKNGITVDSTGSSAAISNATVKGAGPTPEIAQNGIQVSEGALAKITGSTITGNECNHSSCGEESLTQFQSAGVLFFREKPGSSVSTSTINENDIGAYHFSGAETNKVQATIASNTFENDRFEAVVLDQGFAAVNKNTMSKSNVGIQLIQYAGQEFGPRGTGSEDTIKEMTRFAVEGLSDKAASDQFGSFTITKSKISGNPGTVEGSVSTNNPTKLKIFTTPSDT